MNKERYIKPLVILVLGILFGFALSPLPAYPWSGDWDNYMKGYAEIRRLNITEIYLNSVNRTDTLAYPEQLASYIIFKSGSNYYAKSGSSGQIDYSGTNATTIMQSALNHQGKIIVGKGEFSISGIICILDNTTFSGMGFETIFKQSNGANLQYIITNNDQTNGNDNIIIRDLKIDGNKANNPSAGIGLDFRASSGHYCENIIIENLWVTETKDHGIAFHNARGFKILNNFVNNTGKDGIGLGWKCYEGIISGNTLEKTGDSAISTVSNNEKIIITDNTIKNTTAGHGVDVSGGKYVTVSNNFIEEAFYDGILVRRFQIDSTWYEIENIVITNNNLNKNGRHGINIDTVTAKYVYTTVCGNVLCNNTQYGIYVAYVRGGSFTGNVACENGYGGYRFCIAYYNVISDNIAHYNKKDGMFLSDCEHSSITNNIIMRNSREGAGLYDGIVLKNSNYNVISNNRVVDYDGNQEKSINETGTSDYNLIQGNSVKLSKTSPYIAIVGANTIVKNNHGFTTENDGIQTLTSGNTAVNVTHGCDYTPSAGDIQVHPIESLGSASFWWIEQITSTTFEINVNADPTQNVDFAWSVDRH